MLLALIITKDKRKHHTHVHMYLLSLYKSVWRHFLLRMSVVLDFRFWSSVWTLIVLLSLSPPAVWRSSLHVLLTTGKIFFHCVSSSDEFIHQVNNSCVVWLAGWWGGGDALCTAMSSSSSSCSSSLVLITRRRLHRASCTVKKLFVN